MFVCVCTLQTRITYWWLFSLPKLPFQLHFHIIYEIIGVRDPAGYLDIGTNDQCQHNERAKKGRR